MALTRTTNYDNSANFTFESDDVVFQPAAAATFSTTFASGNNADYGDGSLTGTLFGSPTVADGLLDATGGTLQNCNYSSTNNADFTQEGTIAVGFYPNYTGNPAATRHFFAVTPSSANTNRLEAYQTPSGDIRLKGYDSADVNFLNYSFGTWSPVANTFYFFEFRFNFTTGDISCYINGTEFGTAGTGQTATRGAVVGEIYVGAATGSDTTDMFFDSLQVYDSVLTSTLYRPEAQTPATTSDANAYAALKANLASGETFFHSFATLAADRGAGRRDVEATDGTVAVSGGALDLSNKSGSHGLSYYAVANGASPQTGTIEFGLIPTYSGTPGDNQWFITQCVASSTSNTLSLLHSTTTGNLQLNIKDSAGTNILNSAIATAWSPVSGTEYHIEINYDLTSGATRGFIDGTLNHTVFAGTGTRTSTIDRLQIGGGISGATTNNDFQMTFLRVKDEVTHTADFTPDALPEAIYPTDAPSVQLSSTTDMDGLNSTDSLSATTVTPGGSDEVRFTLINDGIEKYWDGAAWSTSNGTFAQANTVADINTNADALDLSTGVANTLKAYLSSSDGTTQVKIAQAVTNYNFFIETPAAVQECIVYGFLEDLLGEDITTAEIKVTYADYFTLGNKMFMPSTQTVEASAAGYFEISLVETATAGVTVTFKFTYEQDGKTRKRTFSGVTIPAENTKSFEDLSGVS